MEPAIKAANLYLMVAESDYSNSAKHRRSDIMFNRKLSQIIIWNVLAGLPTMASAVVMVDNFQEPGPSQYLRYISGTDSFGAGGSKENQVTGLASSDTIGAARYISLTFNTAPLDNGSCMSAGDSTIGQGGPCDYYNNSQTIGHVNGLGVFNNSSTDNITGEVFWNGGNQNATAGLGGVNLQPTNETGFYLQVDYFSQNATVTINVWDTLNGSGTSSFTNGDGYDWDWKDAVNGPGYVFLPFSGFSGVDFSSIDAISLTISGLDGYQFYSQYLQTSADPNGGGNPNATPEPASLALAGVGLLGMGWSRRRLKK